MIKLSKIDKKGWLLSCLVKYKITGKFIESQGVLFDPRGHKILSHIMSLRTFHKCERHGF